MAYILPGDSRRRDWTTRQEGAVEAEQIELPRRPGAQRGDLGRAHHLIDDLVITRTR
jgi:hypothetical protein